MDPVVGSTTANQPGMTPTFQDQGAYSQSASAPIQTDQQQGATVNTNPALQPQLNPNDDATFNGQLGTQSQAGDQVSPTQTSATQDFRSHEPASTGNKERSEWGSTLSELTPMVEMKEDHELEPEVEGWLEKMEQAEDITLAQPITDDQGDVVLADAGSRVVAEKIVMPLTELEMESGLKQTVSSSARWLSEWVKKLMKQMGNKAVYRNN